MVEIFKTNVQNICQAKELEVILLQFFPGNKINFDLDDCDKILRIEGENLMTMKVMMLIKEYGFVCNLLE
jgi:hypothetical protein